MSDINPKTQGATTQVSYVINAKRSVIYQTFLNADAVASWLPPDTMTGTVYTFEPHEGGIIHMSLKYQTVEETPDGKGGKSSTDTDTFHGVFAQLILNEKVVWLTKFDSDDPEFAGEMKLTWSFVDVVDGTEVTVICENIPKGIRPGDNEAGSRSSLEKLANYVQKLSS